MRVDESQSIFFEQTSAANIAEAYGTPTYVYEENTIRENYRRAYAAFRKYYENFRFYYAIKACNNPSITNILRQEGAGIDAASVNEILLAKKLGIIGEDVVFSGNFLSDDDIRQGLESGVIFNLDDTSLLPRLLEIGKPKILSFRVNPGYGRSNVGDYVTNAGPNAKFGIHPDHVLDAYRTARDAGITRFGAHMMPGSCINDPEYFAHITGLLMDIIGQVGTKLSINFEFIDLGGGLGIPYEPGETPLDIDRTAERIAEVFTNKLKEYNLKAPRLVMEPARYFVGDAGFIVGRIHSIKKQLFQDRWVGRWHEHSGKTSNVWRLSSYLHRRARGGAREKIDLCGQICENTDYWIKSRELPKDLQEGDLIVIENAGAYGYCMSYQYNGRLRPAEVLVNNDKHYLIRERETFEDMIRDTFVPDYLQT